jgi:predicted metalloprotease with PDZ domain
MIRCLIALLLVLSTSVPASAQTESSTARIRYSVTWESPETHFFNVGMEVGGLTGETFVVRMPAWRPGRYVMQNYARYVVGFEARTVSGDLLPFEKIDKDSWRVVTLGHDTVVVSYRNYANVLDAGESYLDETEAYLNPVSVLMNVSGRMQEPVELSIMEPAGWRTVSPLHVQEATGSFVADDYHELVDSPFLVSPDVEMLQFRTHGVTVDIAVQGDWDFDRDKLVADHRAIVDAQIDIMGVVPFERYLFMYHIMPEQAGHGVEHKNATSIVLGPSSAMTMPADGEYADGMYRAFLGVASHELFHAWNVERIRPAAMVPTDYSTEQYTTQMWIFEGITDYYGDVALYRAGLTTRDGFMNGLAGTISAFDGNPGRKVTSIAMSSFDSWTKQNDAPPGTFYSFYTAGKAMGVVLDMEVRGRTGGQKSLDDVFRYLYRTYYMNDRGVPEGGFQSALEAVTGTSFASFFDDHIYGTKDVNWQASLSKAGLRLEEQVARDPATWLRIYLGGMTIMASDPEGPAVAAGLRDGDTLTKVGDAPVTDQSSLEAAFAAFSPGDVTTVTFVRDGTEHVVDLEIRKAPTRMVMEFDEDAGAVESGIRDQWLKSAR